MSGEHLRHPVGEGRPAPVEPNVLVWKDGLEDPWPRRARSHVETGAPSVEQGPPRPNHNVSAHRASLDKPRVWR